LSVSRERKCVWSGKSCVDRQRRTPEPHIFIRGPHTRAKADVTFETSQKRRRFIRLLAAGHTDPPHFFFSPPPPPSCKESYAREKELLVLESSDYEYYFYVFFPPHPRSDLCLPRFKREETTVVLTKTHTILGIFKGVSQLLKKLYKCVLERVCKWECRKRTKSGEITRHSNF
jgi:hypothetical protein